MDEQQIITTYEEILGLTGQMLEAARASDWDRLTATERLCRILVDRLVAEGGRLQLSAPLRQRKVAIIRKLLDDDAEIRRVTDPRMAELERMLGSVRNRRRLVSAYGPPEN